MNRGHAIEAECRKCGILRFLLPVAQEPTGRYVRCPFCRGQMLEWRAIEGTVHTTHPLPYAERMGMTQAGFKPEKIALNQEPSA